MKTKIKMLVFQRNGVMGNSFYHAIVDIKDDKKREMIVTFEASNDDKVIDIPSCRAFCPAEPLEKWRGDEIGRALQNEIPHDTKIYDLTENEKQYRKSIN